MATEGTTAAAESSGWDFVNNVTTGLFGYLTAKEVSDQSQVVNAVPNNSQTGQVPASPRDGGAIMVGGYAVPAWAVYAAVAAAVVAVAVVVIRK